MLDALGCGADDGRSTQMTERSTQMTERSTQMTERSTPMTERSTQMSERWLDALDCGADDGHSMRWTAAHMIGRSTRTIRALDADDDALDTYDSSSRCR